MFIFGKPPRIGALGSTRASSASSFSYLCTMSAIISLLREPPWLGQGRALAWTRVLALASVLVALALILLTHGGSTPDPWRRPLTPDFVSFWTAGKLALDGAPESRGIPQYTQQPNAQASRRMQATKPTTTHFFIRHHSC